MNANYAFSIGSIKQVLPVFFRRFGTGIANFLITKLVLNAAVIAIFVAPVLLLGILDVSIGNKL